MDDSLKADEYVQHPLGTRDRLLNWLRLSPYPHPRHADDSGSPYSKAWWYYLCMDEMDRQWQQPYFATHTPANPKRKS